MNTIAYMEPTIAIEILTKARDLIKTRRMMFLCNAIDVAGGLSNHILIRDDLKARVLHAINHHRSMVDYVAEQPEFADVSWHQLELEAYRRRIELCDSMIAELKEPK